MMPVAELARDLPGVTVSGGRERRVVDVTVDSRAVAEDWMFAALQGAQRNGLDYLDDALGRGASAVMAAAARPGDLPGHVAWFSARDPRGVLGKVSRRLQGEPDEEVSVLGITGTDGKTTTAHLLAAALEASGWPTALGGTLGQRFRELETETLLTTPEAPELYRFLEQARHDGARAAVLEVSSAALAAKRTDGMRIRAAILTGIGHDHLDLHGTLEDYAAAKRRLFAGLAEAATAILPAEDRWTPEFRRACPARHVLTFGESSEADWRIGPVTVDRERSHFTLEGPGLASRGVSWTRTASWDARNLAAAVAAACALGADPELALAGARSAGPVPGRWERIQRGQPFGVIVDYAHTPPALGRALDAARREASHRVILVFGCGGNRDRQKRPEMGRIAAEGADVVFVTDDNPRQEDPEAIASEIIDGCRLGQARVERISDREQAIAEAIGAAGDGDVVLVAGRGHERVQKIGDRQVPLDDRRMVIDALARRGVQR
jgi:UDP-N-acetylmuramoyl-L-alanyl-D-glutamate--2,6-diaminopimelate ligase